VTIAVEIPGSDSLALDHLLLDVNGTLTDRGQLIDGVAERLASLAGDLEVHLLSADTFGSLSEIAEELGVTARRVTTGEEKREAAAALGPERCAAIGNGRNDTPMFGAVALAIAVLGPEGLSREAIEGADLVCSSIVAALDLLADGDALVASLRR
jgi:soluble P-type ATPase